VALQVLKDENMAERAAELGNHFRQGINDLKSPFIKLTRGKGLLNAIIIDHPDKDAAWKLCMALKENGLLAKPTHGDKIRLAPPLVITKEQVDESLEIIRQSLKTLEN
ncbi:MAG TPA: aminotransferase class III-fold pyridoxal phosphate-dependent enzyme, partial [Flavisolibacter sp.]